MRASGPEPSGWRDTGQLYDLRRGGLSDMACAARMATAAGDLHTVSVVLAVGAAIFVGGHTRARRVRAFLWLLCHGLPPQPGLRAEMRCGGALMPSERQLVSGW